MRSSVRMSAGVFGVDQALDLVAHGFGGVAFAAVGGIDRGGEEVFQLEHAARAGDVFVRGDAAHGRFMHLDRGGDRLQVQRPQMRDAVSEEAVLLAHDFARHLQDRARALIQALHQP